MPFCVVLRKRNKAPFVDTDSDAFMPVMGLKVTSSIMSALGVIQCILA